MLNDVVQKRNSIIPCLFHSVLDVLRKLQKETVVTIVK